VNGQKKWITNGIYADFFTTAVRTGGKGGAGISMLLIERSPGMFKKNALARAILFVIPIFFFN
jgi:alkylation response protein AidB-like acyl-CoA dehydrogenase